MENLTCNHCGTVQSALEAKIEKHFLHNGGYHLMAYCYSCGEFIKNMPHSKPEVLHFGKHKGKPISIVAKEDESYLRWLSSQDIKPNLKCAITEELEKVNARNKSLLFSRP